MAKFENNLDVHDNAPVANWISQINVGNKIYDIATHHSIKFLEGSEETTWNGLSDLTVVIPTIEDIVQTPIEFAGTVTADETISWIEPHGKDNKAEVGNLVFITVDCTFAGKACEAGDMAIWDGTKWNIVSGENQVELKGTTDEDNRITVAVGAAADVLSVEGKTLALTIDYTDLDKHVSLSKGSNAAPVKFGNMTVGTKYISLNKGNDVPTTIGKETDIKEAKSLANGDVTINGYTDLVTDVSFGTFDAGSLHEIVLNSDDRTFDVTGGSLDKTTAEDFVTNVSLGNVTFDESTQATSGAFGLIGGIKDGKGQSFVTDVDGKSTFTVAGYLQPTDGDNTKFVTNTGNYVTGLNAGSFTLTSGDALVTGFSAETTEKGDVISSVEVSANNDTSVLYEAAVDENHVLSFNSVNVASGVTVTPKYKSLTKTGFTYIDPTAQTTTFTTSGFTKVSDVTYTLGTAQETTYTTELSYYKITTPKLEVSKGGYSLSNTGMVTTISKNTFAVNVSGGVLPSMGKSEVSRKATLTGTVGTALDFDTKTIKELNSLSINMPGTYELSVDNTTGDIAVGAEGALAAKSATIDLSAYVTDVAISDSYVNA